MKCTDKNNIVTRVLESAHDRQGALPSAKSNVTERRLR